MAGCRRGNSVVNRFALICAALRRRGGISGMKLTMEEQQKRSERARLKAYSARRRHKKLEKTPKVKQAGFKNMRLVNKSNSMGGKKGPSSKNDQKNHPMKITKLPPGEARGARDLQRWSNLRRG
jgi:hypothetical protein